MAMYCVRVPDDIDLKSRIAALAREREPQWQTLARAFDALRASPPADAATTAPDLAARLASIERRLAALENPTHGQDLTSAPLQHTELDTSQTPNTPAAPAAIDPREREQIILAMASQSPRPTNPAIGKAAGCSEATVRRVLKNQPHR